MAIDRDKQRRDAIKALSDHVCPHCKRTVHCNSGAFKSHIRYCTTGEQQFWKRVTKSEGCWLYRGHTLNTGHADLMRMRKKILAHRYSWMIHNGPIPAGQQVLHTCDVPLCVRPDHLFLGTQAENNYDRHAKGRSARGEMVKRNKLTEEQAKEILALKGTGPASRYAPKYGVNPGAIHAIWRGDAWAYLSSHVRLFGTKEVVQR